MTTMLAFALRKLLTQIAVSLISEKFLEWAFFNIAGKLVKYSETKHDDEWLEKIKESYFASKEK